MTNKQAIDIIRKEYKCVNKDCDIERSCGKCELMMPSKEPILQAYEMAIQALSQEPNIDMESEEIKILQKRSYLEEFHEALKMSVKQEPCDDAISRPTVVRFEGTNMACMGGDEIMKEFENNTQQHCNDRVISLERAKKQIGRWIGYIDQDMINRICISLEQLPSVTQKSGKWINDKDDMPTCSKCGYIPPYSTVIDDYEYSNYCPNCGAKMESEVQTDAT